LNEWLVTVSVKIEVDVEFIRISPLRNWGVIGAAKRLLGTIKLHNGNKDKALIIKLLAQ
tara:strand:- start:252 stop:428 length:177 start_codon:yes stop_codon:yes gene_type:complete